MKSLRNFLQLLLLSSAFALGLPLYGESLPHPDDRDRQVIESVLLHLLANPEFKMSGIATNTQVIVLHVRTPGKTGSITPDQIHADLDDRALPNGVESDMRKRNTPATSLPGSFDSVSVFYTNLTFVPKIVVADISGLRSERFSFGAFEQAYPAARGWVEAYLPGYSKDGIHALVRAEIGPSPHGAVVTALLTRKKDKWIVKWSKINWYA